MTYPKWPGLDNDPAAESLVPPLGARTAPGIKDIAVMVSTSPDLSCITSGQTDARRTSLFNSSLFTLGPDGRSFCVTGPFTGAPYAVMLLEALIKKDVRRVLVLGWCGAVSDECRIGDILVPRAALVQEGTSANYMDFATPPFVSRPSDRLTEDLIAWCKNRGIDANPCTVWTTDAIYRETSEKAAYFRNQGAAAVDMECSALFSVAAFRQVEIAALLIVSDVLEGEKEGGMKAKWTPGFKSPEFKAARRTACDVMVKFVKERL